MKIELRHFITVTCILCLVQYGRFDSRHIDVLWFALTSSFCTGYSCLFRHANDEANFCIYLIPGNPDATAETLAYWHEKMMKEDPNISRALGNNIKTERMKAGGCGLLKL